MSDQLFVSQLQNKVEDLKTEFDLIKTIKDDSINLKIQRSRDKICEILRKVNLKKVEVPIEKEEENSIFKKVQEPAEKESLFDVELLQRRNYIFQFKMYLRRKRQQQERKEEFKLLKLLDDQTQALQRWVKRENNDIDMFDFFYSQIDLKKKGVLHELQMKQFFFDNPMIMFLFNFDRNSLQGAIDTFKRKERFHFTYEEFIQFLTKYQISKPDPGFRQYIHLFDPTYKMVSLTDDNPRILLLSDVTHLKQAFQRVENQGLANLDKLIREIRNCNSIELLEKSVHVVLLGLNLVLESALQIIELEFIQDQDVVVSWNQFLNFFDNLPPEQEEQESQLEEEEQQEEQEESEDDYFYNMMSKKEEEPQPLQEIKQPKVKVNRREQHQKEVVEVEKKQFTVPKKQQQEEREKNKSPGIRQKWVEELVRQKQCEEEQAYKYKPFKANKIPYKVRDRNYYQELQEKEELRRRDIKDKCKDLTMRMQRPFSFDQREEEKKKQQKVIVEQEESQPKFRANPVPWFCSLQLYDRKVAEQRLQSEQRKKIRMFWLSENSKLPPRMEAHLESERLRERASSDHKNDKKQKLIYARPIPDFAKLHKEFQRELQKRKKQAKTTKGRAPKFNESKKKAERKYLDNENQSKIKPNKKDPIKVAQKALNKKPKWEPKSTLKFDTYVQLRQLIKWSIQQDNERSLIEQQQRDDKKRLFVPRVQQSWAIVDHEQQLEERRQQKQIEAYQRSLNEEKDFNNMMKEIFVRVYQRPLLMEIESMKSQQMPQHYEEEQQYDYMNPIGEQEEEEESEKETARDPEGVDQVGEQAEQSHEEEEENNQEYYDNNFEYDGQDLDQQQDYQQDQDQDQQDLDEIDFENIDPRLLEQAQREALAREYGLSPEQLDQIQFMQEPSEDEEEEEEEYYKQKRHSF